MPKANIGEIERELIRKHGIGIRIYNSNHSGFTCNVWREMHEQPLNKLEEEVSEYLAKKNNLKYGFFDISNPGEPQFSEKSHVWYNLMVCNNIEEIESKVEFFTRDVKEIEQTYQQKIGELTKKILELPLRPHKSMVERLFAK